MWLLSSRAGRRWRAGKLAVLVVLSALGAGALSGTASAASLTVTVSEPSQGLLTSNEFAPQVLNAQIGDTVTFDSRALALNGGVPPILGFVNAGSCVAAGSLPSGISLAPGTLSPAIPLTAAGTYYYFDTTAGPCSISWTSSGSAATIPQYAGKIVVTAPSGTSPSSPGAALTATVAVASQFKSVTISTNSETFGNCNGGSSSGSTLGFPNGQCSTPSFSVNNNGSVPEAIDVQATNATPADNGTPWTLMGAGTPGLNQYQLKNNLGTLLGSTPTPDSNVSALQPGTSVGEELALVGPSSSSDPSGSFSTTATWTAL